MALDRAWLQRTHHLSAAAVSRPPNASATSHGPGTSPACDLIAPRVQRVHLPAKTVFYESVPRRADASLRKTKESGRMVFRGRDDHFRPRARGRSSYSAV